MVELKSEKRELITEDNGDVFLRHYDEESKMWINVHCSPKKQDGTEYIKKVLKEIYLKTHKI